MRSINCTIETLAFASLKPSQKRSSRLFVEFLSRLIRRREFLEWEPKERWRWRERRC
jgi:hypothetical protein